MKAYIFKRILTTIPLLLCVSFLCFVFINLIPSDPAEVALRVRQTPVITEEAIEEVREELRLNDPYFVRYIRWLGDCLTLDFGVSYTNPSRTVLGEISRCLPATVWLAGASLLFVIILSLPIGFLCAVYQNSWFDKLMRALIFMTTAMPAYWIGLLLIWLVSIQWDLLPTSGSGSIRHMILPAFTVSLTYISTYIRLIRNNMLENMKEDYVLYAKVRGLKQKNILVRHILKNSLHTCIVAIGMSIPQLIAGTIVVENVFAWPGLGKLCIESIFNRDYPVIQIYVLLIGTLFVIFNLLFDIIQYLADPRLRGER
ncbi:nickel/cobalt ABC transporter permease [Anaerosacchariphilus polymeriproducens]|uniref:ABC transporter permease subunit n=1 Tax=Anaerosacchariphilus polymeriproducens TaxID=1812858 RepID=A0A371AW70_9FIRM|nr:nickel/cobalt ABC transporter permease [Anaerosacchariphilus polymeriproducens]RDU23817.1 ABC transporter permease subunit [Anaerosacchariphilus polymeriproducens]